MAGASAVFFDLDGTLADTAPDLGGALNRLLAEEGRPPLPLERLRPHVSKGARGMLGVGFGLGPEDAPYSELQRRFLDHYEAALCEGTALFPGMAEVLHRLDALGIPWGIVTNKSQRFTNAVAEGLGLRDRAAGLVCGDTCPRPKPHPLPILMACALAGADPAGALYVGDDRRDIEAGRAAGTLAIAAAWGYLEDAAGIDDWQADRVIGQPIELLDLI